MVGHFLGQSWVKNNRVGQEVVFQMQREIDRLKKRINNRIQTGLVWFTRLHSFHIMIT